MSFNNKYDTKNWITKTLPIDTFGVGKFIKVLNTKTQMSISATLKKKSIKNVSNNLQYYRNIFTIEILKMHNIIYIFISL